MNPPVVLVVEDERLIARDLAMLLADSGYTPVGPATTGDQAIEMAGRLRPQLVLMDVHLGSGMDGITAAQAIREQFDIPCVFLSAFAAGEMLDRAKLAKPAGFLGKPFTEEEMSAVISAAFKVP
jgi:CheY-like chemotaxis protein